MVQETARTLQQFKGEKCKIGVKPLLSFSGSQFDSPSANEYTLAKSIFLDFFKGAEAQTVDVEGLQLLISFFAGEESEDGEKPKIHVRCWKFITRRSGQKVPRVEVEEMGPRIDFKIGRMREAENGDWKEAMKKAKGTEVETLSVQTFEYFTDRYARPKLRRMWRLILWAIRLGGYISAGKTSVLYKHGR